MRWTNRHGWRWHAFRATAMVTTAALAVPAATVLAADDAPSNIDLLAHMTSEVAEELYGKFSPGLGQRSIELRPFANGEDYTFVGNVFTSVLTSRGVPTIAPVGAGAPRPVTGTGTGATTSPGGIGGPGASPATDDSSITATSTVPVGGQDRVVLTFQNIAFGVAYPDVYRSHLIGGKRVKRHADVRVHATLTDPQSGRVLWVGEAAREKNDEFDQDDSARIEMGAFQFARPVLPGGGWGKYAEPVFVTGIIVGLIYLFFSNQSDN